MNSPTNASDAALIVAAQAGSRSALDALLRRHQTAIERVCRRMCGDETMADDVIQETYLAIMRSLPAYRGDAGFLTWVYTIARTHRGRAHRTATRDRGRHELLGRLGPLPRGRARGPEERVADQELGRALEQALLGLAPLDREILILRDHEGLTAAEVSERVWLTVPAVKTRLHRARVFVRAQLAALANGPRPVCEA